MADLRLDLGRRQSHRGEGQIPSEGQDLEGAGGTGGDGGGVGVSHGVFFSLVGFVESVGHVGRGE